MTVTAPDGQRMSDRDLLAAIAAGDGRAFSVFYRRHLPATLAYLMRETRNPETAGDLAAETFTAVLLASRRYVAQSDSATAWVIGIARNKLLMSLRRGRVEAKARVRLGFQAVPLDDEDLARIEAVASSGELGLSALIEELPVAEREAVRAHVVEERSYRELAVELECSEMVVRKRVSRGLERLRRRLNEADTG